MVLTVSKYESTIIGSNYGKSFTGRAVWSADVVTNSKLQYCRDHRAGSWDRRQHRDLQRRQCGAVAAAAVSKIRTARRGLGKRLSTWSGARLVFVSGL